MPKPPNGNRVLDSGVSEVTSSGASDLHSSRSDNVWPIVSQSRGCPQGHWAAKCFPRGPQSDEEVRGREQQEGVVPSIRRRGGRGRGRAGQGRRGITTRKEEEDEEGRTRGEGEVASPSVVALGVVVVVVASAAAKATATNVAPAVGSAIMRAIRNRVRGPLVATRGEGRAERISNKNKNTKPSCCLTGSLFGETSGANLLVDRSKNSVARASRETVGRESLS